MVIETESTKLFAEFFNSEQASGVAYSYSRESQLDSMKMASHALVTTNTSSVLTWL